MIIQTVTKPMFRQAFIDSNRQGNFSYSGLDALFEFLDGLSDDVNFELDVIAICCDFTEDAIEDIIENYDIDTKQITTGDEWKAKALEYLEENTLVIYHDDEKILYQNF